MCNYNEFDNFQPIQPLNCGCDNFEQNNRCPVDKKYYNCNKTKQVIKHQRIVKHQHDIINEYDIVHEHDYNYYDVVKEREVDKHNDHTCHDDDNYCENDQNNCRRRCR